MPALQSFTILVSLFPQIFYLLFRVCTLMFEPLRFYLLYDSIRHHYDDEIRSSTKYVLNRCYIGDWFVLYQLSRKGPAHTEKPS